MIFNENQVSQHFSKEVGNGVAHFGLLTISHICGRSCRSPGSCGVRASYGWHPLASLAGSSTIFRRHWPSRLGDPRQWNSGHRAEPSIVSCDCVAISLSSRLSILHKIDYRTWMCRRKVEMSRVSRVKVSPFLCRHLGALEDG
jgi:hypothetical protein